MHDQGVPVCEVMVDGPVVPVDLPVKIGDARPGVELGGGTWGLVVVVVVVGEVKVVAFVVVLVDVVAGNKGELAGELCVVSAPVVVVVVQFPQRPLTESYAEAEQ